MKRYHVYGKVTGSIYLGEFSAKDEEEAMQKATEQSHVGFCHQCNSQCEDPEVEATAAEEAP